MTKTIKISEKTHKLLSELASKNETFNDVIDFLINYYYENEEFSDEQAEVYNKDIERFENGNLENVSEVTLKDLEKRISKLEHELKKWRMDYFNTIELRNFSKNIRKTKSCC